MTTSEKNIDPTGLVVLGIWAHPDDEAYLSAGLMVRTTQRGGRVMCVHATLGELGTDDPVRWPPDRLGPHRLAELRESLGQLGVDDHVVLGYADGECATIDPVEPISRLREIIEQKRPDVMVTFGPDGITGHPDHVAISGWATAAWCANPTGRLLYATSTESFMRRYRDVHRRVGIFGPDAARVDDGQVAARVVLTEDELERKRRALAAHASQTVGLAAAIGESTYRRWYDIESFREPTTIELRSALSAATA